MQADDRIRLQHMLDAAVDACQFIAGQTPNQIETDKMRLFAIIRCIEIIGEAASDISAELRLQAPEIPWKNIIAMRNRLIHGYFDVDTQIVWQTVTTRLPTLIGQIQALLCAP